MRTTEIAALMRAHGHRAHSVASLHILRQAVLDPDDHTFLSEHVEALNSLDLLRWWTRCEKGHTAAVLRHLAGFAIRDPGGFTHEILNAPRLELDAHAWTELTELLRGKIPDDVWQRLLERGRPPTPAATAPAKEASLDALDLSLGDGLDGFDGFGGFDDEGGAGDFGGAAAFRGPPDAGSSPGTEGASMARIAEALGRDPAADAARALVEAAMERAQDPSEDWSALAPRLPAVLRDAVLVRARATPREEERSVLLEWLEQHGAPPEVLVELTLGMLRSGEIPAGVQGWLVRSWLPRRFAIQTAWERHGEAIFSALIDRRAWAEMSEFVPLAWVQGQGEGDPHRGYLGALQLALAQALVGLAREAREARDGQRALAALAALLCLGPPPQISAPLHALRALSALESEALELLATLERQVQHGRARDVSLEDTIAAVHALADALG